MNVVTMDKYRQAGYAPCEWGTDGWRAVWLDVSSVTTGNLLFIQFLDSALPVPYSGTIYRTLHDLMVAMER